MGRILAIVVLLSACLYGQDVLPPTAIPQPNPDMVRAHQSFESGMYKDALDAFAQTPTAERDAFVLNRMGMAYHMLSMFREAETAYRLSIRQDEDYAAAYNNFGALYYSRQNFGAAEKQIHEALERDAENSVGRRNLRSIRYARENGRRARDLAAAAVADKPLLIDRKDGDVFAVVFLMPQADIDRAFQIQTRGDSFYARKMYEDAIIEYRKAINIDRYNPSLVNRIGLAYYRTQNIRESERYYKEALKVNPFYIEALNNLGSLEYTKGRYRQAIGQYEKALKMRPNSPTVLQNIGACLFAMERYEDGVQMYLLALQLDPKLFENVSGSGTLMQTPHANESMMHFYMAKVFAGSGDLDRAISSLYKAWERGFTDRQMIQEEPAFIELLADERFLRLMETMSTGARNRR